MTSLVIDDLVTTGFESRGEARERLFKMFATLNGEGQAIEDEPEGKTYASRQEFFEDRERRLRPTWGHDPVAQSQWVR